MKVGAKFTFFALAHHRRYDFATDNKTPNVRAARFLDELLHHEVGLKAAECFDYALGGFVRLGENDTDALRAFEQLDHHRGATDQLEKVIGIARCVGKTGDRQTNAFSG
jgi:hypothetical protein